MNRIVGIKILLNDVVAGCYIIQNIINKMKSEDVLVHFSDTFVLLYVSEKSIKVLKEVCDNTSRAKLTLARIA